MNAGAALVTGGAVRIGRALVLALAGRGYDVAIHYNLSKSAANEVVETARGMGVRAVAIAADFLDEKSTESLVERARVALARDLTVLVNNASIFEHDTVLTATRESWDRHLESNLRAPFVLTQNFARQSRRPSVDQWGELESAGLVVNIVDQRVLKPTSEFATYTVAKMALWSFTQAAAIALAPAIRVNAIGPGPTIRSSRQSAEHFQTQRENTILARGPHASDVAAAMNYFLDAKAVTGQLISVDGGQHLTWKTVDSAGKA